jgi:phytoene synthase
MHSARLLGRAMQYINFIRDIAEDNTFGRTYLPISETSMETLSEKEARANPEEFRRFIGAQIERYLTWQAEAEAGYPFIPRRYRVPIKTAGDMYKWTGQVIAADPFVVFDRKVKPNRARIVFTGLFNTLTC